MDIDKWLLLNALELGIVTKAQYLNDMYKKRIRHMILVLRSRSFRHQHSLSRSAPPC